MRDSTETKTSSFKGKKTLKTIIDFRVLLIDVRNEELLFIIDAVAV